MHAYIVKFMPFKQSFYDDQSLDQTTQKWPKIYKLKSKT